jgi:hypothetical protein
VTRAKKRGAAASLGVLLAGAPLLAAPATALSFGGDGSGESLTYDAIASATAEQSRITNQAVPLGLAIQGDGPIAQSRLTSLGASNGFASFPYPGDVVVGVPGLVKSLLFPGLPVPDLPIYVSSAAGDPPASKSAPGLDLRSESSAGRSTSTAILGTAGAGANANSKIEENDDGSVVASGTVTVDVAKGLGLFSVSGLESAVTATLGTDGKIVTTSRQTIGRIVVPGLSLTLPTEIPPNPPVPLGLIPGLPNFNIPTPAFPIPLLGGLTIEQPELSLQDGQFLITVPTPMLGDLGKQTFTVPNDAVFAAFKAAGLDVSIQKPIKVVTKTMTSIVAGTLTIRQTLPAPPPGLPAGIGGPTGVQVIFGLATASIQGTVAAAGGGSPTTGVGSTSGGTTGVGSTGSSSGGGPGPVVNPNLPGSAGFDPGAAGSAGSGGATAGDPLPPVIAPDDGTTEEASPDLRNASLALPRKSVFWFYIVLVGVAVAGTAGGQILRYLGVRASWSS